MRWGKGDLQIFLADLLVVLVPVALVFATLGLQGWRIGGVEIRLYQFLLIISVPFALVQSGLRPLLTAWRTPGIPAIGLCFLLSILSTVLVKDRSFLEAREVKNTIIPVILSFFVILGFATSYRRMRRLLLAAMIGIAFSVTIVSSGMLTISFGVRPISQLDLFESFGLTYIWLGVGSATVFGVAVSRALDRGESLLFRLIFLSVALPALAALLTSGTRGAAIAAILTPALVYTSSCVPPRAFTAGVAFIMLLLTVASLFPDLPLRFLGASELMLPIQAEGAERFTRSEAYQSDLVSRLVWWKSMQEGSSLAGALFGVDYDQALIRTGVLGHPHNVLVWARLMAGLPAALALAFGLTRMLIASLQRLRTGFREIRSLAIIDLYLLCLLIPVLLTNSWPGGTLLVFALSMALSAFLSRAVQESAASVPAASGPTVPLEVGHRAALSM